MSDPQRNCSLSPNFETIFPQLCRLLRRKVHRFPSRESFASPAAREARILFQRLLFSTAFRRIDSRFDYILSCLHFPHSPKSVIVCLTYLANRGPLYSSAVVSYSLPP